MQRGCWAILGLSLSVGCAAETADPSDTIEIEVATGSDTGLQPFVGSCPDVMAMGTLPETVFTTTEGADHTRIPGCGSPAPDVQIAYVAPRTGAYLIDTLGSDFDTLLAVILDDCRGDVVACNDDWLTLESQVWVELVEGQTVVAHVDAYDPRETGNVVVTFSEAETVETTCDDGRDNDHDESLDCLDADCAAAEACDLPCPAETLANDAFPMTANQDTTGLPDRFTPPCGVGIPSSDATFGFTAPAAGWYRFDTNGSPLDTVLSAWTACDGQVLACNDDHPGGGFYGYNSELTLELDEGESVVLAIEGYGGGFGPVQLTVRYAPAR